MSLSSNLSVPANFMNDCLNSEYVAIPKYTCWDCGATNVGLEKESNMPFTFCFYCQAPYDLRDWPQIKEPEATEEDFRNRHELLSM